MSNILHKQLYAGILAVLNDKDLYYQSTIGKKGEYNHFKDGGKEAVIDFIETFAPLMLQRQKAELDARAKELVVEELKR
jgi:hypothetical protein